MQGNFIRSCFLLSNFSLFFQPERSIEKCEFRNSLSAASCQRELKFFFGDFTKLIVSVSVQVTV